MRVAIVVAVLVALPVPAAAWNYGLENARIETTNASATDFSLRRVWTIDDGNVVSRVDNPLAAGGGDWISHGNGGSPAMPHGLSATSYVSGTQNFEHVFYVGQDDLHKNLPTIAVAPGGAITTWTFSFDMGLGAWGE